MPGGSGFHLQPGDLHGSGNDLQKFGNTVQKMGTKLESTGSKLSSHSSRDRSGVGSVLVKSLSKMTKVAGEVFKEGGRVAGAAGKRLHQSGTDHQHNEKNTSDSFKKLHDGEGKSKKPPEPQGDKGGGKPGGKPGDGGGSHDKPGGDGKPHKPPEVGKNGKGDKDSSVGGNNKDPHKNGNDNKDSTGTEDPIDLATGRVFLEQTDVRLAGALELVLSRGHRSDLRCGRFFGASWSSTMDQRVEVDDDAVHYLGPDGMLLSYPVPGVGAPVLPVAGRAWPLAATGDGGYTITRPDDGQTLHFRPVAGQYPIVAITDRNGYRVDISHAADGTPTEVAQTGGRRVAVDTEGGRITALRLPGEDGEDGDLVLARYSYDEAGLLAAATNGSGAAISFEYDHAGRLARWEDRNGMWYRYEYDHEGRCVRARGRDGALDCEVAYEAENRTTTHTNSLGGRTSYLLNDRAQIVQQTDALGGIERMEWDANHRLLSHVDQLGNRSRYDYDAAGNMVAITAPDGGRTLTEYNALHQAISRVEPDGAIWRHEYDERGNLTAETDPAGAVTRYGYDERGALVSRTDAAGHTMTVESDDAGLPVAVTDPSGATVRYIRDAFGRVSRIVDHLGRSTEQEWSIDGDLTVRRSPDGSVQRWVYDGEGNEVESLSPTGAVRRIEIGLFDLPVAQVDANGGRLVFGYDTEMRMTSVTEPSGLQWTFTRDAVGNVISETDLDGRTTTYTYDAAHRLLSRINAAGEMITLGRDLLGNVVEKRTSEERTTFERDEMGRIVRAVNRDSVLTYSYDPLGRVLAETCNGRTVSSTWDSLGRRIGRRTPSGADTAWEYTATGLPSVVLASGRRIEFGYDAAGNEVRRSAGAALLRQGWDANDQLESQAVTAGDRVLQHRAYRYRQDGYLADVVDQLAGPRAMELDPTGRVTEVRGREQERYRYDQDGNIVTATASAAPLADSAGGREYAGTQLRRAGNVSYGYDEQGRMVHRQQKRLSTKDLVWRYTWDAEDRLTGVVTPDGTRWRYHYDALGRRIAKQRLDADGSVAEHIHFAWDDATLTEQAHTGPGGDVHVLTWDYQPDGVEPISQAERRMAANAPQEQVDERFYAIVTDLTGTPTELLDPAGNVAWHAEGTIWGAVHTQRGSGAYTPLRFPGQYHDPETGLYYNNKRHYDPATGRYASLDPLGLEPAPNPRTYVHNPLRFIDPLGLAPCKLGALLKGWKSKTYKYNGQEYTLDNAAMKHILQRHHPDYWDGTVANQQTFFKKRETPHSIELKIREIMKQNPNGFPPGPMGQITGQIDGQAYTVGHNVDRIGQFYPG